MGTAFFALDWAKRAMFDSEEPPRLAEHIPSSPEEELPELEDEPSLGAQPSSQASPQKLQELIENPPEGAVLTATWMLDGQVLGRWAGRPDQLVSSLKSAPVTPREGFGLRPLPPQVSSSVPSTPRDALPLIGPRTPGRTTALRRQQLGLIFDQLIARTGGSATKVGAAQLLELQRAADSLGEVEGTQALARAVLASKLSALKQHHDESLSHVEFVGFFDATLPDCPELLHSLLRSLSLSTPTAVAAAPCKPAPARVLSEPQERLFQEDGEGSVDQPDDPQRGQTILEAATLAAAAADLEAPPSTACESARPSGIGAPKVPKLALEQVHLMDKSSAPMSPRGVRGDSQGVVAGAVASPRPSGPKQAPSLATPASEEVQDLERMKEKIRESFARKARSPRLSPSLKSESKSPSKSPLQFEEI